MSEEMDDELSRFPDVSDRFFDIVVDHFSILSESGRSADVADEARRIAGIMFDLDIEKDSPIDDFLFAIVAAGASASEHALAKTLKVDYMTISQCVDVSETRDEKRAKERARLIEALLGRVD